MSIVSTSFIALDQTDVPKTSKRLNIDLLYSAGPGSEAMNTAQVFNDDPQHLSIA